MKHFTFTSALGVPFLCRIVRNGDNYGLHGSLIHCKDKPLVEFYDTRYPFWYDFVGTREDAIAAGAKPLGQFVSRYYVSTLRESRHLDYGLALHGGVPGWNVDPESMRQVHQWMDGEVTTTPVIIARS